MFHTGLEDAPLEDQSFPQSVREWLVDHKEHVELKGRIERMRADLTDQPQEDLPLHGLFEQKEYMNIRELIKALTAELTKPPRRDALVPERPHHVSHTTDGNTCLRKRRGILP